MDLPTPIEVQNLVFYIFQQCHKGVSRQQRNMRRTTVFPACGASESIEPIIEGRRSFGRFGSTRPLPPFPVSKLHRRNRRRLRKGGNLLKVEGGKGVGMEPNLTTARKPGPLKIFNPLCGVSSSICTVWVRRATPTVNLLLSIRARRQQYHKDSEATELFFCESGGCPSLKKYFLYKMLELPVFSTIEYLALCSSWHDTQYVACIVQFYKIHCSVQGIWKA